MGPQIASGPFLPNTRSWFECAQQMYGYIDPLVVHIGLPFYYELKLVLKYYNFWFDCSVDSNWH